MPESRLTEGLIAQVQAAALEARPRDAGLSKPRFEASRLKTATFEDAIIGVDLGDQLVLDRRPSLA